jgi:hypothetical protein
VFVVVALMGGVTTTVMDVVHVVAVRDGDMPTPLGMHVVMANVLFVRRCHLGPSSRSRRDSRFSSRYHLILGDAYIFIHCIFGKRGHFRMQSPHVAVHLG